MESRVIIEQNHCIWFRLWYVAHCCKHLLVYALFWANISLWKKLCAVEIVCHLYIV